MFKLATKLKGLQETDVKKYIAIYLLTVFNFAFLVALAFISENHIISNFFSGNHAISIYETVFGLGMIWSVIVMPAVLIAYGMISYKRTKMIILPHLLLLLAFALIFFVFRFFEDTDNCFDGLLMPIIMISFSLITSVVTAIYPKEDKNKNK